MRTIELSDLTLGDVGHQVTITVRGTSVTGELTGFHVAADTITEATLGQSPDEWVERAGRRTVSVSIGPWSASGLPASAVVQVGS